MRYHFYFIDTFGEPYCKVQSEDEEEAKAMLMRHSQKSKRVPKLVEKTRFLVSVDDTVIIMTESWV